MLQDVLYCPDLCYMLVSLAKCDTAGFTVLLKDKCCSIKDSNGHQIGRIPQYDGLYRMDEGFLVHLAAYKCKGLHLYSGDYLSQQNNDQIYISMVVLYDSCSAL